MLRSAIWFSWAWTVFTISLNEFTFNMLDHNRYGERKNEFVKKFWLFRTCFTYSYCKFIALLTIMMLFIFQHIYQPINPRNSWKPKPTLPLHTIYEHQMEKRQIWMGPMVNWHKQYFRCLHWKWQRSKETKKVTEDYSIFIWQVEVNSA